MEQSWPTGPGRTRVGRIDLIFTILSTLLFGLDRIIIIFFGARAVMEGTLSVGMLVAFLAYKDQFSQRVGKLLDTIMHLGTLTVHGERIADIALAEPEHGEFIHPIASAATVISGNAGLSARTISFRYSDNEPRSTPIRPRFAPGDASPSPVLRGQARRPCSRSSLACYALPPVQC